MPSKVANREPSGLKRSISEPNFGGVLARCSLTASASPVGASQSRMVGPRRVARRVPSGLKAIAPPPSPASTANSFPVATSQRRIPPPVVARRDPSRLKAKSPSCPGLPSSTASSLPVAASQSRVVLPSEVTSRALLGLNAADKPRCWSPSSTASSSPVAASSRENSLQFDESRFLLMKSREPSGLMKAWDRRVGTWPLAKHFPVVASKSSRSVGRRGLDLMTRCVSATTYLPSPLNLNCPLSPLISTSFPASKSQTKPPSPPSILIASRDPSGLKAKDEERNRPSSTASSFPDTASHTWAVASKQITSFVPSGLNLTE